MYEAKVEIYSDEINLVVLNSGRVFPGILIQGDDLHGLCYLADKACGDLKNKNYNKAFREMNELRNRLRERLSHYKKVLVEHEIRMPFNETPLSSAPMNYEKDSDK